MKRDKLKTSPKRALGPGIILAVLIGVGILTLTLKTTPILSLVASATSSLALSPVTLYFTPYEDRSLQVGDVDQVDINVNARTAINAIGITIKYPQDLIDVVGVSKERSFLDLWTEETAIREETGEVHFSGGSLRPGGLTGTSTALTLSIKAKKPGDATLSFEDAQVYASDGTGRSLDNTARSLTFHIEEPHVGAAQGASGSSTVARPAPKSADLNGDGKVDLTDMSILVLHIFSSYDPMYDLDMDGMVGISDLSILFSKMSANN